MDDNNKQPDPNKIISTIKLNYTLNQRLDGSFFLDFNDELLTHYSLLHHLHFIAIIKDEIKKNLLSSNIKLLDNSQSASQYAELIEHEKYLDSIFNRKPIFNIVEENNDDEKFELKEFQKSLGLQTVDVGKLLDFEHEPNEPINNPYNDSEKLFAKLLKVVKIPANRFSDEHIKTNKNI